MRDALLVFSRFPRLGKVKTRLSSLLTPAQCLQLHRALLLDTLDRIADLDTARCLFLGDCSAKEMRQFAQENRLEGTFRVYLQSGNNLGRRMWNAYRKVSRHWDRIIFLGIDTPSLPLSYIERARTKLGQLPLVVGPVEDGGYYLLALSEPRQELFEDIDWGTSSVLEQTLSRMSTHEYLLLPPWYDVDRPADLRRLETDLKTGFEGFPRRTHALLRSSFK